MGRREGRGGKGLGRREGRGGKGLGWVGGRGAKGLGRYVTISLEGHHRTQPLRECIKYLNIHSS